MRIRGYNRYMRPLFTKILLILLLVPMMSSAASLGIGKNYSLKKTQVVAGDFYAIGGNTTVVGLVDGDVVGVGGTVFVGSESITESVLVVADTAHIVSTIGEDLRVVSRKAYIGSTVQGDMAIAAVFIDVLPQTTIGGDFLAAGGDVNLQGKIIGDVRIAGGRVFLNEAISGNVSVTADSLVLGPNASIEGSLTYSASEPLTQEDGAVVAGSVEFQQIQTRTKAEKFLPTIWGTWIIIRFAVLLLFALAAHGILRNISYKFVSTAVERPFWNFFKGFLVLVVVPIAAIIGLLTFIGIPFSLFALSLYGILVILSAVYVPIILGSILSMFYHRTRSVIINWKTIVAGVGVTTLLNFIPFFGNVLWYSALLVILGGIYQVIFDKFIEVR
jgi:hypothetical protein